MVVARAAIAMITQTEITEAMRSVVAFLALTIKTTMPVIPSAGWGTGPHRLVPACCLRNLR